MEGVVYHAEAHGHGEQALVVDFLPEELDLGGLEVFVEAFLDDTHYCVLELLIEVIVYLLILYDIFQVYLAYSQRYQVALQHLQREVEAVLLLQALARLWLLYQGYVRSQQLRHLREEVWGEVRAERAFELR